MKGLVFEKVAVGALQQWYGMALHRSGGRADKGVDFFGTWTLPPPGGAVSIIGQCKNHARKAGPGEVREFGSVVTADAIGLLVHTSGFSRECVAAASNGLAQASPPCLALLHLHADSGALLSVHLNAALKRRFPSLAVGRVLSPESGGSAHQSLLMWDDVALSRQG